MIGYAGILGVFTLCNGSLVRAPVKLTAIMWCDLQKWVEICRNGRKSAKTGGNVQKWVTICKNGWQSAQMDRALALCPSPVVALALLLP